MHTFSAMVVFARLPFLRPALTYALLLAASAAYAAGPTGLLNDTGQTQCDNGSNAMAACTIGNTGDAATYKRQDGRFGRDPAAPAKVGGGVAGFDFTRVCFNGDLEGAGTCTGTLVANTTGAATGTASTDWACTQDNVTKLIWSLQTQSATWNAASAGTYPDAGHNTPIRCGFSTGWRLPTRRELLSIVHLGLAAGPMVDANYFPATQSDWYWTSDDYAPNTANAWVVDFNEGGSGANVKTDTYYVRLVRSQPPPPTSVAWANLGGYVPDTGGILSPIPCAVTI